MTSPSINEPSESQGSDAVSVDRRNDVPGLDQLSRRGFFRLAGAGAAAAGLAACSSRPARQILPYANQPPELTPGLPLHYATALVEDGFATGVLVASYEGRPTKIEGNPDHPASLGATRAVEQAAVLSLYDPQRARQVIHRRSQIVGGEIDRGMPAAWSAVEQLLDDAAADGGRGLHLLLEPTSSPMVIELLQRVRTVLPAARMTFWSPFAPRASLAGNRLAFGRPLMTQLDLRGADVIVALDADLTGEHPMSLVYSRQISDRRRVVDGGSTMSRIYAIEASTTSLGVIADHRLRVRASQIAQVAAELVAALVRGGVPAPASAAPITGHAIAAERTRWVTAIARDLARAPGRSVVVAGERQPPIVHALVAAINALLGNLGKTVGFTEPVVFEAGQPSHDLAGLVGAIERGEVRSLVVLGGNPAYTAPADLPLAPALQRVERSLYLGLYDNETAHACRVMVPALHSLEDWGDARAYDGTLTPVQPLIEPLFDGRSVADVLHRLLGDPPQPARDRMYTAWGRLFPAVELDAALARGAVAGTGAAHAGVGAAAIAWPALAAATAAVAAPAPLELELRPHPYVHDGRYTNNPWLLELPEPITKLTWDNAAQLSPHTAARLGVHHGDVLALTVSEPPSGPSTRAIPRTVEAPAIVVPGHADDVVTLHTGFGRDGGESTARGIGANAFRLWTTATGFHPPVTAAATGRRHALAVTQVQDQLEGRPDILTGTLRELAAPAMRTELARHREPQPSLYKKFPAAGAQWAMSIDLTTCTGCSACVMACAAENNTPVVGKREVLNRREMHWLRIDRYVLDDGPGAAVAVQPMTCQHCELAPCEYVCPVEATTHSPDGLNEMTYNRCIGTRFCSNNCPYKVRRFNWFDFKVHSGLPVLGKNPNVTVRDRGVMEKCTYCVQRIRRAEIDARIAGQPLGGNAVTTACQQACPTEAIRFGSISDPSSTVSEHRRRPHSYAVLHDQGTRPRTRYLARIRNPNAELDNREGDPGGAREGDLEEDR